MKTITHRFLLLMSIVSPRVAHSMGASDDAPVLPPTSIWGALREWPGATARGIGQTASSATSRLAALPSDGWRFAAGHPWALAALGATGIAGGTGWAYWYYRTAFMNPRIEELRTLLTQITSLLEYSILPWDAGKQEIWRKWLALPDQEFNQGILDIENNLGLLGARRGAFWQLAWGMANAVRIIDNFKQQFLHERLLARTAMQAGRPIPEPGIAFKQAVKELTQLIAASLTRQEEVALQEVIRQAEEEAKMAKAVRLAVGASGGSIAQRDR